MYTPVFLEYCPRKIEVREDNKGNQKYVNVEKQTLRGQTIIAEQQADIERAELCIQVIGQNEKNVGTAGFRNDGHIHQWRESWRRRGG